MTYILIGIVMAFYLGFAAYVEYEDRKEENKSIITKQNIMQYVLIGIAMAFCGWIAYSSTHNDRENDTTTTMLNENK